MTTPNIEELIAALTQTNQFHESADICTADVIDVLQSQAERIAKWERESETHAKAYGLAIVERDNLRHELKTAQDVTELVEALEKLARLGNGDHYGNSDGNMIARDALSKYKGAK